MSIFMKEMDFSFYKRFFIYNYKIKKFIKKRGCPQIEYKK